MISPSKAAAQLRGGRDTLRMGGTVCCMDSSGLGRVLPLEHGGPASAALPC